MMENELELTDKEKAFLIGLEKLTRETGILIGGCGCCASPFLEELEQKDSDDAAGYGVGFNCSISWVSPANSHKWKKYHESIVKSDTKTRT